MEWQGKRVWITGASSGIGEALAYGLARRGARLVLSARNAERLEDVRRACSHPEQHQVVPLDLSRPETVAAAVALVMADGYGVDVLLNNGGLSQRGTVAETALSVDRYLMEVNYFAAVALTKAVLPAMQARRAGHIVAVSSVVGFFGTPRRSSYAASKHALHGFCDALRAEVWHDGVRVTVACPGYIRTNISRNALTADGSLHGQLDPGQAKGLSAEACAERIIRAVEQGKPEVVIARLRERTGVYLRRFVPALFFRIIRRTRVT
jgi:short-subunit dehydrogenase